MMKGRISIPMALGIWLFTQLGVGQAQVAIVRESAESVLKSLSSYFSRQASKELAEQFTKEGGEAAVRSLVAQASKEGGESAVASIARLAAEHGPEAITALRNSDSLLPVLKGLEDIPALSISTSLRRLAAGQSGKQLAQNLSQHGSRALFVELAHPGVGTSIVGSLGDDGMKLAEKLGTDSLIQVSRHADDIARLPGRQREGVLKLISSQTDRMVAFLGRFVEKNPGATLFTVATTTVLLAESDRILGGDEIVFDDQGNPHLVSKPGLAGRSMESASQNILKPTLGYLLPIAAVGLAAWIGIRLWGTYRRVRA